MTDFGDKLREYRTRLGVSTRTLAARSGFDAGHLTRIENGQRSAPRPAKLLSLITELHLTRKEAAELVRLAGYPETILSGGGLAYSSPTLYDRGLDFQDLSRVLERFPPERRQRILDALVQFADALAAAESRQPQEPQNKDG